MHRREDGDVDEESKPKKRRARTGSAQPSFGKLSDSELTGSSSAPPPSGGSGGGDHFDQRPILNPSPVAMHEDDEDPKDSVNEPPTPGFATANMLVDLSWDSNVRFLIPAAREAVAAAPLYESLAAAIPDLSHRAQSSPSPSLSAAYHPSCPYNAFSVTQPSISSLGLNIALPYQDYSSSHIAHTIPVSHDSADLPTFVQDAQTAFQIFPTRDQQGAQHQQRSSQPDQQQHSFLARNSGGAYASELFKFGSLSSSQLSYSPNDRPGSSNSSISLPSNAYSGSPSSETASLPSSAHSQLDALPSAFHDKYDPYLYGAGGSSAFQQKQPAYLQNIPLNGEYDRNIDRDVSIIEGRPSTNYALPAEGGPVEEFLCWPCGDHSPNLPALGLSANTDSSASSENHTYPQTDSFMEFSDHVAARSRALLFSGQMEFK